MFREPLLVVERGRIAECSRVIVGIRHADSCSSGPIDGLLCRHRIPVNPDDVQKLLPIGIRRQQRRQHRRARCDQWAPRPPDVKVVDRRQCHHGSPFPDALLAKRRDRQPAFDQAGVQPSCGPRRSRCSRVAGHTGAGRATLSVTGPAVPGAPSSPRSADTACASSPIRCPQRPVGRADAFDSPESVRVSACSARSWCRR